MPFCHACHAEYRSGFRTCADCGSPLTQGAPPSAVAAPNAVEQVWRWVLLGCTVGTTTAAGLYLCVVLPALRDGEPLTRDGAIEVLGSSLVFGGVPGALGGFLMGHLSTRVARRPHLLVLATGIGAVLGLVYGVTGVVFGAGAAYVTALLATVNRSGRPQ